MSEVDYKKTPEEQAAKAMLRIKPYLQYMAQPNWSREFMAKAREKDPFLNWVCENPEVDPALYFYASAPPVIAPPPEIPYPIVSPGWPKPDFEHTLADVYHLLERIAAKLGA